MATYEAETIRIRQDQDRTINTMKSLLTLGEDVSPDQKGELLNMLRAPERLWYYKRRTLLFINEKMVLCLKPLKEGAAPCIVLPDLFKFEEN